MKYVCLLRGINVGGNNKITMSSLVELFTSMGFTDVVSYINSGNIIFSSVKTPSAAQIRIQLKKAFGLDIPTLVLSGNQVIHIADSIPEGWLNDEHQKTDVLYLFDEIDDANIIMKIGYDMSIETAFYVSGAVLWNVERRYQSRSGLRKLVGSPLYAQLTVRNINTARRLADLCR